MWPHLVRPQNAHFCPELIQLSLYHPISHVEVFEECILKDYMLPRWANTSHSYRKCCEVSMPTVRCNRADLISDAILTSLMV